MGNVHTGDLGTEFKANMKNNNNGVIQTMDLTGYDVLLIDIENESGTVPGSPFAASLVGPAVNGIIHYINTGTSIITLSGTWRYRGIIKSTGSGLQFTGSWIVFEVDY